MPTAVGPVSAVRGTATPVGGEAAARPAHGPSVAEPTAPGDTEPLALAVREPTVPGSTEPVGTAVRKPIAPGATEPLAPVVREPTAPGGFEPAPGGGPATPTVTELLAPAAVLSRRLLL